MAEATDFATLLADYVPRADYEASLQGLNDTIAERDKYKGDHEASTKRLTELEMRVRTHAARDAYGKLTDKLKIDPRAETGTRLVCAERKLRRS